MSKESDLILIVDDSRMMRLMLRKALEDSGLSVEEAENGQQALDLFPTLPVAAILLDVSMPGLDGFTVCQTLRTLPHGKYVPIMMVTSHEDIVSITKAFEMGATDFITKPVNWDLIGYRVRYLMHTHESFIQLQKSQSDLSETHKELTHLTEKLEKDFQAEKKRFSKQEGDLTILLKSCVEKVSDLKAMLNTLNVTALKEDGIRLVEEVLQNLKKGADVFSQGKK